MLSLERRMMSEPISRASMESVNMQCERDEFGFIGVSLIARFVSPTKSKFKACGMT